MKPIQTFSVVPRLPVPLEALRELAYNLRWAWNHDSIELFRRLDNDLWETCGHNPVLMLGLIQQETLEQAARDDAFLAHLKRVAMMYEQYMNDDATWSQRMCKHRDKPLIAYFSAEFGLTECLSIFAGGLGILAGDHLKSASDLGLPLIGIGLLYQQGYFRQYLSQGGWQQEDYATNDFHNLPVSPAIDKYGKPVIIEVDLAGRLVYAQVWRAQVGRIPLYLLDTNITQNTRDEDRDITDQLYGGGREMRIKQEILLGIGGYRALQALEIEPTVYHMNEGHAAFVALEHVSELMHENAMTFAEARELASSSLVFTTHTPVEAGHDYFSPEQMERYFSAMARNLGLSMQDFLNLGRTGNAGEFCMTVLALRFASRANGVSKLHGEVSRRMWQSLWPGVPVDEIPISHVTNGVHFRSWISIEMNQLYDRYLGPHWREEPANGDVWNRAKQIPALELWRTHERRRIRLVAWARNRVMNQRIRRGAPEVEIEAAKEILNPDALTIGFARRFATYKRATLILHDLDRLKKIMTNPERPVQLIFAGKAHPQDEAGKELIRQITTLSRDPEFGKHIVFLEDYDMAIARYMVQGVDVWLNNPLRPMEASGTSGMKAAANAVLNLSVLDGWWDEVWRDENNSRSMGWAIGNGEDYQDHTYQDHVEAEALYDLLERDVIPTFYDQGPDRVPRKWVERMKACLGSLCHFVNTHRMVSTYMCDYYIKSHDKYRAMAANSGEKARELAAKMARIRQEWGNVRVAKLTEGPRPSVLVADQVRVEAEVQLGSLTPNDVRVELYVGRTDARGEIVGGHPVVMEPVGDPQHGTHKFVVTTTVMQSGEHGFTMRVLPAHPDLVSSFVPGLICWADGDRVLAQATR